MKNNFFFKICIFYVIFLSTIQLNAQKLVKENHYKIHLNSFGNILPPPFNLSDIYTYEVLSFRYEKLDKELNNMVFFDPTKNGKIDSNGIKNLNTSLSIYLFADTSNWKYSPEYGNTLKINTEIPFKTKKISEALEPFYIKKSEVTNGEYLEFVFWVRDSIARRLLADYFPDQYLLNKESNLLNWKTPIKWDDDSQKDILEYLDFNFTDRYYHMRQTDPRKLIYNYTDEMGKVISIPIYPDTNVWINDFKYNFNEPMAQNYFWHPAYEDYPVVGVTYWQTLAFCNWKQDQLNKRLKLPAGYELEVTLPNYYQWNAITFDEYNPKNNFDFDLNLTAHPNSIKSLNLVKTNITKLNFGPSIWDGGYHTLITISGYKKINYSEYSQKINIDQFGISNMGNNVSEWLINDYAEWNPIYTKRRQVIESLNFNFELKKQMLLVNLYPKLFDVFGVINTTSNDSVSTQFISEFEKFKYSYNTELPILKAIELFNLSQLDTNGKMVIGSNWYDERYGYNLVDQNNVSNFEGVNAKTFVLPSKSSSLIGFRYVVKLKKVIK